MKHFVVSWEAIRRAGTHPNCRPRCSGWAVGAEGQMHEMFGSEPRVSARGLRKELPRCWGSCAFKLVVLSYGLCGRTNEWPCRNIPGVGDLVITCSSSRHERRRGKQCAGIKTSNGNIDQMWVWRCYMIHILRAILYIGSLYVIVWCDTLSDENATSHL